MVRTITALAVFGALLVLARLWLAGDRPVASESLEPHLDLRESSTSAAVATAPSVAVSRDAPAPAPLRTEPNILTAISRQPLPDVEVPPWADAVEGSILSYIAQQPGLELTELQVQCGVSECVIFMGGRSVPVYQMNFDVFASENGFASAVIYSIDGGPNRIVYLRR